uniref:GPI transamidase component GPI16 n=1 Tax=Parastrongyloides trichosuri TaxID=131310 RepID=A0A0N4ZEX8_PARTI
MFKYIVFYYLLFFSLFLINKATTEVPNDTYTETLYISRLKNQKIFVQFNYGIKTNSFNTSIFDLFPRTISDLSKTYSIEYLSFSLSFSNWLTSDWGYQPKPEHPVGASIKVHFKEGSNPDILWPNLVQTMSGIFCGSWKDLDPFFTKSISKYHKEAIVSEESVCTENFSPFLKLLPCKGTAGLASLMNTEKFYEANYHSISLEFNSTQKSLNLFANYVEGNKKNSNYKNFDFESIFGKKLGNYKCNLASSSKIYIEMTKDMNVNPLPNSVFEKFNKKFGVYDNLNTDISSISVLYENPYIKGRERLTYSPLISVQSSTSHIGEQSGSIITKIWNRYNKNIPISLSQSLPWYIKVYIHSLSFQCNHIDIEYTFNKIIQSKIRDRPYYFKLTSELPPSSLCILKFNYGLHFLKTTEYPPDAEKGRVIEGVMLELELPIGDYDKNVTYYDLEKYDVLTSNENIKFIVYGHPISIQIPLPDFSMPFNVICMVCTIISLFYGPLHTMSTKVLFLSTGSDKELPLLRRIILKFKNKLVNIFNKKNNIPDDKVKVE